MVDEIAKHTGPVVASCLVILWVAFCVVWLAFTKVVIPMWRAPQTTINDEFRRRIDTLEGENRKYGDRLTEITTAVGVASEILKDLKASLQ